MSAPGIFAIWSLASATSGTQGKVVVSAILAVLFAIFGYRLSVRNEALRGVTPWRFPSIIWALICFAIGPFGIIVELLAEFTTRPRSPAAVSARSYAIEPTGFVGPSAAPAMATPFVSTAPPLPPPADDGTGKGPLFGWYPDVTKRHELRYWDGKRWSDFVANRGERGEDPL